MQQAVRSQVSQIWLKMEMFRRGQQFCGIGGSQEAESFADITFGSPLALGGTSHSLDIVYRAQRLASFLVLPEISYLLDGNSDLGPGPEAMLRCLSLF